MKMKRRRINQIQAKSRILKTEVEQNHRTCNRSTEIHFFLVPNLDTGNRDGSKTSKGKYSLSPLLKTRAFPRVDSKDKCSLVYDDFRRELNPHFIIYSERVQLFLSTKKINGS